MKTWPIDPLGLRNIQLEVSGAFFEERMEGVACGQTCVSRVLQEDMAVVDMRSL